MPSINHQLGPAAGLSRLENQRDPAFELRVSANYRAAQQLIVVCPSLLMACTYLRRFLDADPRRGLQNRRIHIRAQGQSIGRRLIL
jgi:hypothetical protein